MVEKTHQRLIHNFKCLLKGLACCVFLQAALWGFKAEAQEIRIISDEETEAFLADVVQPLFRAADIPFARDRLYIVEDNSLNAFVSEGNRLFVHTGTLIRADSVNELAGVLAHETGHIMGGHILRQKLKAQEMQSVSLISAILAGTTAVLSGRGDAAMAVLIGGQSSALANFTRYRADEERAADEAAVTLLAQTQQSPKGLLDFMKKINRDNQLSGIEETPYFRTHPVTRERISFFDKETAASSYGTSSPLESSFQRVKAKLKAYLMTPKATFKAYPADRQDVPALYARAIANLKKPDFKQALALMDTLLSKEPDNPYFYELQGQILLETGALSKAKNSFAKACALLPNSPLMQLNYAQTLLEDNPDKAAAQKAASLLTKALVSSKSPYGFMLLSKAYGLSGDMAAANYAAAEYSYGIGNTDAAQRQLKEALKYKASPQLKLKINDLDTRLKSEK